MDSGETDLRPERVPPPAGGPAADAATLDSEIGPFFDTATLSSWFGVSRRAIYRLKRHRIILAMTTSDRRLAFPAWQFSQAKEPLPALPEVLAELDPTDEDAVGSALWHNTLARSFGGATPAELLRRGDLEAVLAVARQIAAAWQA